MVLIILFHLLAILILLPFFIIFNFYSYWYSYIILLLAIRLVFLLIVGIYALILMLWSKHLRNDDEVKEIKPIYHFLVTQTAKLALHACNVIIIKKGFDKLPTDSALYVTNHISGFDGMIPLVTVTNKPLAVVTKIENLENPISGRLFHQAGFIHIDRNDDFQAVKALLTGINHLRKNTANMHICPEGTRNRDSLVPQEYHGGSFKAAYKGKRDVVVMALNGTNKIKKHLYILPTIVKIEVVEVIKYEELKELSTLELAQRCRENTKKALGV